MKASDRVMSAILETIGTGAFPVGGELPAEAELAERFEVSRLTVREAIGQLAAAGVLEVRQGRRNRVAEVQFWTVLDPDVVAARARLADDTSDLVNDLMEARQVLEVGIARLAARRITDTQLHQLALEADRMRACIDDDSLVAQSAAADMRFHEVILEAARNDYLAGAFEPLARMLMRVRLQTSATRAVRAEAVAWHDRILTALRSRDPDAAARAMAGHMEQTRSATREISLL